MYNKILVEIVTTNPPHNEYILIKIYSKKEYLECPGGKKLKINEKSGRKHKKLFAS
jgi:uncharacterized membrane protein (UPF0127 family)